MPELSDTSVQNNFTQNYISKMVAIALLEELLESQEIDEDIKKRLLKKFGKNLQKYSENIDLVQNLSIKVLLSLEGIEIIVPEGVEVEFAEVKTDLDRRVRREIMTQASEWVGQVETESLLAPQTFTVKKCPNPQDRNDPRCRKESTQAIESLIIMR